MPESRFVSRRQLLRMALAAASLPFAATLSTTAHGKDGRMRRIFITGSTDGLGRGAALEGGAVPKLSLTRRR